MRGREYEPLDCVTKKRNPEPNGRYATASGRAFVCRRAARRAGSGRRTAEAGAKRVPGSTAVGAITAGPALPARREFPSIAELYDIACELQHRPDRRQLGIDREDRRGMEMQPGLTSGCLQCLPYLPAKRFRGEGLLQEKLVGIQNTMVDDRVVSVTGNEQRLGARAKHLNA